MQEREIPGSKWDESSLVKFSKSLGFSTESVEGEILKLLLRLKTRRDQGKKKGTLGLTRGGAKPRGGEIFGVGSFECQGCNWRSGRVYGPTLRRYREFFWEELGAIRRLWNYPWCIGGDFNMIRFPNERRRGGRVSSSMRRFLESTHPRLVSDHFPILLDGGRGEEGAFILAEKLNALKVILKSWNKDVIGKVGMNKRLALDKVAFWDTQEKMRILSMEKLEARKEAKGDFEKWALMEEISWRQKSKEVWLREGDRNTGFFHKMANSHRRKNCLSKIKVNGTWLTEEQEIKGEGVVGAFKNLLTDPGEWHPSMEGLDFNRIDGEDAARLEEAFSEEEVFSTLSDLNEDKAPGPNGFSLSFWSLNSTLLVLIPKKAGVEYLRDFRPISLVGGLYKLLAKVLANRIKKVVGKVVSSAQNAFVEGRQILDAALIVNEAIDSMLKEMRVGLQDKRKKRRWALVSHLLFADDTLVFCDTSQDQMAYLSWLLMWFEAISGLRINLDKSEILPIGRVENLEVLALEVGCKVGRLPTSYLGIPLGANHKSVAVWDGVEERFRKRLAMWKRQFISRGGRITLIRSTLSRGALERKPHLVKWDSVCLDKRKGGLGLRRLSTLNRALLCKWNWGFANERKTLWRSVISRKFGEEEGGWYTRDVREGFGVGFWKDIRKEGTLLQNKVVFSVGNDHSGEEGVWSPSFSRPFNDWEVEEVRRLLLSIRGKRLNPLMEDRMLWKETKDGIFSVKSLYSTLVSKKVVQFPISIMWNPCVPTKVCFFAWEAFWGKVLTLDQLKKRGRFLAKDASFAVRKKSQLIIFLFNAPGQECYGSYCLLFLVLLGSFLFRLEIPLVVGVALTWARSAERCGRQPLCVFFGRFGKKEIGLLLIMRSFRSIG
ncbi:putative ribonuclease H protein [Vitis vinifera]|uniref:Putative ribonuclease H protein n=1 Tax=Vitis vinifera TaxID=29760 RepID=A0A438KA07_VITVI|nr:putative ribonuclease H protein [Vitis vinifera]